MRISRPMMVVEPEDEKELDDIKKMLVFAQVFFKIFTDDSGVKKIEVYEPLN